MKPETVWVVVVIELGTDHVTSVLGPYDSEVDATAASQTIRLGDAEAGLLRKAFVRQVRKKDLYDQHAHGTARS